jgi:predicted permease
MSILSDLGSRLRALLFRSRVEREMAEEMAFHLERETEERIRAGASPEAARREARLAFGGTENWKEATRDARGTRAFDDLVADVRYALRSLRRAPGFTVAAVASLGCGIALVAITLTVVNAYLIRSLPYPDADRLHHVVYAEPGEPEPSDLSALDWTTLGEVVEAVDYSASTRFYLTDGGYTEEEMGLSVAPGSLDLLGVRVAIGRRFEPEDFLPGAEPVVLIGQRLWRERFGGDSAVAGRLLRASTADQSRLPDAYRIVGVLPSEFRYARGYERGPMEIVVPLQRPLRTYMVLLRDGVPVAEAERRLTIAVGAAAAELPSGWRGIWLESVQARYVAGIRQILVTLTAAAALVLIIVTGNVAILTLLRNLRRQQEVAIRLALGAGTRQILRLLTTEAVLLTGMAVVVGLAVTIPALGLLVPWIEANLGRSVPGGANGLRLDPSVLLLIGGAGLTVALALAAVPLLASWWRKPAGSLHRSSRTGTDGLAARRARSALVAMEVAGTLALLVGCGLMTRSMMSITRTDLGITTSSVVRSRIALPNHSYLDAASRLRFYERFADDLSTRTRAGVAFTGYPPLAEGVAHRVEMDDATQSGPLADVRSVSPEYFTVLEIPIIQGRGFAAADRMAGEPVVIVSEALAARLSPSGGVIGRRIRSAEQPGPGAPVGEWRTIVGVVRDVRQSFIDQRPYEVYLPFYQLPAQYAPLLIRTELPVEQWREILRATAAMIDPNALIGPVAALASEVERQSADRRFLTSLLTGFAALAALIAILGIYGVTAYAVRQREREVAIRSALGATGQNVVAMFLKEAGRVLGAGVALGLLGATLVARMIQHQLHGVPMLDGVTLVAATLLLLAAGLLATWWPARRAAGQNPSAVLRAE